MASRTTTVGKLIDFCSLHTSLQTFFNVGGITNEPGLTICNNTIQSLIARNMPWKFNRKELVGPERGGGNFLVTQYGVQDYRFAGAVAFVISNGNVNGGGCGIDLAASPINGGTAGITSTGGIVTVQTLDPHPFQQGNTVFMSGNTVAAYNSSWSFNPRLQTSAWSGGFTIATVPDNLHFTFAAGSGQTVSSGSSGFGTLDANGNLTGLFPFGWMESASLQDVNTSQFPPPIKTIQAVHELGPNYVPSGNQPQVCMLIDYDNGVLKFRLSDPPGSYPWQINIVYQAKAPIMTTLQSVMPWPDDMAYVLYEVALFNAFRYAKGVTGKETMQQMQIAGNMVMSALQAEGSREDGAFVVAPEQSLMQG